MTTDPQIEVSTGGESGGGDRPADTMATLLEQSEDYRTPQRSEIVEGTIMGWDRDGMLVDIGAKSEGIAPRNELQSLGPDPESKYKSGDTVFVYVVQTESADGQIMLSIDRARGEHGWHTLQERFDSGEIFEATVTGHNKGGLLVNVEGVNAFVPMSQVVGFRPERGREDAGGASLADAVGRPLRLKVIEINRRRNRVILSERAALQEWRMEQKERLIQELHEGDIRRGRITSVRSFGVFVDLGGADGLAHLSELSWERDKSPMDLFNVGDEVNVYITKIDPENKKIALSLRRAQPEQWDNIVDKYKEGQVVVGRITKLVTFGAFARIEGPVEGLIHVSELVDRRIGHPKEVAREGDLLPLKVVRIERDRQRLGLSLRRAREEGEEMGFVFSDGGEVLSVPEGIRNEFEAREGPPPARTESYDDEESPRGEPSFTDGSSTDMRAEAPSRTEDRVQTVTEAPRPVREPEPEPLSQLAEQLAGAVSTMNERSQQAEEAAAAGDMTAATVEPEPAQEIEEPVMVDEVLATTIEPEPAQEIEEPVMVDEVLATTIEPEPAQEIEEPVMVDEVPAATEATESMPEVQPSVISEEAPETMQAPEPLEEAIAEPVDQITAG